MVNDCCLSEQGYFSGIPEIFYSHCCLLQCTPFPPARSDGRPELSTSPAAALRNTGKTPGVLLPVIWDALRKNKPKLHLPARIKLQHHWLFCKYKSSHSHSLFCPTIKQRAWQIYFCNIMSDAHPKVGLHSPFGNPLLGRQQHPARVTWRLLIKSGHCRALTNFCGKSAKVPSNAGSFAHLRSTSRNFSARFAGMYPANFFHMRSRP